MRRSFTLLLSGLLFTLGSCEGETKIIKIVSNESSKPITVEAIIFNESQSFTVESGDTKAFYVTRLGLGATGEEQNPSEGISTFLIVNSSNDTCTKDYTNTNNWLKEITHKKKCPSVYDHYYTYMLTDSDF